MFAAKSMGDGFAIQFDGDCVKSCCDGEVTVCFPTGHAFGIKTEMGNEILIHIGIDTVEMKGEGFEVKVTPGTKVKKGDLLVNIKSTTILERLNRYIGEMLIYSTLMMSI